MHNYIDREKTKIWYPYQEVHTIKMANTKFTMHNKQQW